MLSASRFLWVTMIVQKKSHIIKFTLSCTILWDPELFLAFTNLKKLDKETITWASWRHWLFWSIFTAAYFQGQHISGFFNQMVWESKVAAWPPEQAVHHGMSTAAVKSVSTEKELPWSYYGNDLDLSPGSRLPSQRGGGSLYLELLHFDLQCTLVWALG